MVKAPWSAQVLNQENRANDHTNKGNEASCPNQSSIFYRSEKVSKSGYEERATRQAPKEEVEHNLPRPRGPLYKWHTVVRTGFPRPFFATTRSCVRSDDSGGSSQSFFVFFLTFFLYPSPFFSFFYLFTLFSSTPSILPFLLPSHTSPSHPPPL